MSRKNYLIYTTVFLLAIAGMVIPAYVGSGPANPVAENTPATVAAAATPVPATSASRQQRASIPATTQPAASNAATSTQTAFDAAASSTSYTIPITSPGTILDAMRAFASSSAFTFTGREYPSLGFFVESIGGKANGSGMYWMLYINDRSSSLGASSAMVAPGDMVEWRYEK